MNLPGMDRPMYYDRQGQPMAMMDWARKHSDVEYKRVAVHYVRGWMVSTVWLGLDHNFSFDGSPPVIFETMIFPPGDAAGDDGIYSEEYMDRYATEEGAQAGHDRALAWLVSKLGDDSAADITGPLTEADLPDDSAGEQS